MHFWSSWWTCVDLSNISGMLLIIISILERIMNLFLQNLRLLFALSILITNLYCSSRNLGNIIFFHLRTWQWTCVDHFKIYRICILDPRNELSLIFLQFGECYGFVFLITITILHWSLLNLGMEGIYILDPHNELVLIILEYGDVTDLHFLSSFWTCVDHFRILRVSRICILDPRNEHSLVFSQFGECYRFAFSYLIRYLVHLFKTWRKYYGLAFSILITNTRWPLGIWGMLRICILDLQDKISFIF